MNRWPAIAGIPRLARPRQMVIGLRMEIDAVDCASLSQGQYECVPSVEVEGSRAVEGCPLDRRSIGRRLSHSRPGEGVDDAGSEVDDTHAMVADVADIEVSTVVEDDRMRLFQLGFVRWPSVSAEPAVPFPAMVEMIPVWALTRRTTSPFISTMYMFPSVSNRTS